MRDISAESGHTAAEVRLMKRNTHTHADACKQPLPDAEIQRNARHGKTASHLPQKGDLPITVLEKEIPKTDLHDM